MIVAFLGDKQPLQIALYEINNLLTAYRSSEHFNFTLSHESSMMMNVLKKCNCIQHFMFFLFRNKIPSKLREGIVLIIDEAMLALQLLF